MKLIFGETLPQNHCMLWQYDAKSKVSPIDYFANKYGYPPTQYAIGTGVEFDASGLELMTNVLVQPGHIQLR